MNLPTLSPLLPTLMEAFGYVLRSSLLGAVAVSLVVFARWMLGARLAPAARGWLWLPVALLCLSPRLPALFSWDAHTESFAKPVREVLEPALNPIVVRGEPTLLKETEPASPEVIPAKWSTQEKLASAWAAGSGALFAFWLLAYAGLWRRVRREQGVVSALLDEEFRDCVRKSGLRRAPRLLVTRAVDNPAVAGLWRPAVLMPPGLEESLDRSSLRHVLLHELGHIRRYDLWLHWISALVVALHWFNPFVWFASRKLRADREAACDASVIHASDGQAHAYGQTLLVLGSRSTPGLAPRLLAGMLGGADLVKQRIVDITCRSRNSRAAAWGTFLVMMMSAGMLAVMAAEPAPQAASTTEVKTSPDKPASSTAPKTDSSQLYTRTFRVPPDFFTWIQEQNRPAGNPFVRADGVHPKPTAVELLKQLGVPFPEGASAIFMPASSQLIVRNNPAGLEFVEAIIDARLSNPIRQIYVSSRLVVFKEGTKPNLHNLLGNMQPVPEKGKDAKETASPGEAAIPMVSHPVSGTHSPFALSGVYTDPQFRVINLALAGKAPPVPNENPEESRFASWQKELADQIQAVILMPAVTTRSGQRATVEVAREFIFPTVYEKVEGKAKDAGLKVVPTSFEMQPVGFVLEIDPVIGPDGYTIDLELAPQLPSFTGWKEFSLVGGEKVKNPTFDRRTIATSVSIWDGQTVAFAGESFVSPFLMDPKLQGDAATVAKQHPVMIFVTANMITPLGQQAKAAAEATQAKTAEGGVRIPLVPFRLGPKYPATADLIEVLEVRSTSPKLAKGDTIVVKGRCRVGSTDEAELRLMTTVVSDASGPAVDVAFNQTVMLQRGVHAFEFRYTLEHEGFLNVSLRKGAGGAICGKQYFGTQEQIDNLLKNGR